MMIRKETEQDFEEIYNLVKVAFQTANVSDGKEQDFVNQLRGGETYIPELALVAEEKGCLVGHIMLSKATVTDGDNRHEVLYLAPVSVVLGRRNAGIGSALIGESFRLARKMGYTAVFLVGDPAYYRKFGFRSVADYGVTTTHDIPVEYVMACELVPQGLEGVSGKIDCF